MTMHLTHDGAPGHVADATERGWYCACGAGTEWPDGETRDRSRATGGARRHLTAAARNNPGGKPATPPAEAPAEAAQAAAETPAEEPAEEPPMTYADRLAQANAATPEFRTP
jgi:hypothetical protein